MELDGAFPVIVIIPVGLMLFVFMLSPADDEPPYGGEDPVPEEAEEDDICLRNRARWLLNQTYSSKIM